MKNKTIAITENEYDVTTEKVIQDIFNSDEISANTKIMATATCQSFAKLLKIRLFNKEAFKEDINV